MPLISGTVPTSRYNELSFSLGELTINIQISLFAAGEHHKAGSLPCLPSSSSWR